MNKTVLLCDRKRRTARRSARSPVLCLLAGGGGGYPSRLGTPVPARGYSSPSWGGTPLSAEGGTPVPARGTPVPAERVPLSSLGYPCSWEWGTPVPMERTWNQTPGKEPGTGVPPRKDLGPETWERTFDWDTLPPGVDRQSENITFPRTSNAGDINDPVELFYCIHCQYPMITKFSVVRRYHKNRLIRYQRISTIFVKLGRRKSYLRRKCNLKRANVF